MKNDIAAIKNTIIEYIETFIEYKIILAQEQICKLGAEILSKKKPETIMIIGSNIVVEQSLIHASKL